MTSSGSVLAIRAMSEDSEGRSGTIARASDLAGFMASSRRSRRNPPLRVLASGPWHLKQCVDRMGRTSRRKSTGSPASDSAAKPMGADKVSPVARTRTRWRRMGIGEGWGVKPRQTMPGMRTGTSRALGLQPEGAGWVDGDCGKKRPVAFATGQGSRLQTRLRQTAGFLKTNQGRPTVIDQVRMEGRRPKRSPTKAGLEWDWSLASVSPHGAGDPSSNRLPMVMGCAWLTGTISDEEIYYAILLRCQLDFGLSGNTSV